MKKTKVLAPKRCEEAQLSQFDGVTVVRRACSLLGACVGSDRSKMSELLMDTVEKRKTFFKDILSQYLTSQEAHALCRASSNHFLTYALSCVEPSVSKDACVAFDKLALSTIKQKTGLQNCEITGDTLLLARQPLRLGGIGIPSTEALAPLAFIAGQARASRHLPSIYSLVSRTMPGHTAPTTPPQIR